MKHHGGNPHKKHMHEDGRIYGKYKLKPNRQIPVEDLALVMADKPTTYGHTPVFKKPLIHKSYTAFVFLTGCRRLEPVGYFDEDGVFKPILKEHFTLTEGYLFGDISAFKHGERGGPLKIRLREKNSWQFRPGIEYILKRIAATKNKRQVWPLSRNTAYRVIVRALGVPPHWLRHNWITTAQKTIEGTAQEVDAKIMSWTGIKSRGTLDEYRLKTEKDISEVAESVF